MSALHRGYCTLAVRHEKCLNPAFFKVSIDHLQSNPHVRPPPAARNYTWRNLDFACIKYLP